MKNWFYIGFFCVRSVNIVWTHVLLDFLCIIVIRRCGGLTQRVGRVTHNANVPLAELVSHGSAVYLLLGDPGDFFWV